MTKRNSKTTWSQERIIDSNLQKQIDALNERLSGASSITVSIPEPDTSFTIVYERFKNGVKATLAAFIPGDSYSLITRLLKHTEIVDEDSYNSKVIGDRRDDIEDEFRAAGRMEYRFNELLQYNTVYNYKRLISIDEEGGRHKNPEEDPVFAEYPGNILHTFTTPEKFGVPSAPALILILTNRLDPTTQEYDVEFVCRVYAPTHPDTGAIQTYAQADVDRVEIALKRIGTGKTRNYGVTLSEEELTQVDPTPPDGLGAASPYFNRGYVDIEAKLVPGAQYRWTKNIAYTNGERKVGTPASPVEFYGANLREGSPGLTELTINSFTATVNTDESGPRSARLVLVATQSNPAVALRTAKLARKKEPEADAAYNELENHRINLRADEYHIAGGTITITWDNIRIKPKTDYEFRANIVGLGGVNTNERATDIECTLDNTVLNEPSAPATGLIISNQLDPTTKKYDAVVVLRVHAPLTTGGAAQTWGASKAEWVQIELLRVNTGKITRHKHLLNGVDLTQTDATSTPPNRGYVDVEVTLKAAAAFQWTQNVIMAEGEKESKTPASTVQFNAGGNATAGAGITELTSVSLTLDTSDPYDGKQAMLTLNYTQPAVPVSLRDAIVEVNVNGAGFKQQGSDISLKKDTYNTTGAVSIPLKLVKTKKLTSHQFRVTITAEGGATRQVSLTQTTGDVADPGIALDTAAPNNGTTLTAPKVKFGPLGMRVQFDTPTLQMNSHTKNTVRLALSDALTCYWNGLNGADRVTSASVIDIDVGKQNNILFNVSKADAQLAFVAHFGSGTATAIGVSYTISNAFPGTTTSNVTTKNLSTEATSIVNSRDVVDKLDVFTTMFSAGQICENGDFLYATTSGGTTLNKWDRRQSPFTSSTNITTTTSDPIFWDKATHSVMWISNTSRLYAPIKKRFVPGEYFAISFMAKTDGSHTPSVTFRVRDTSNNDLTEAAVAITLTGLTTTYKMYGLVLRIDTSATMNLNKWVTFETASTLSASNDIIVDKVMIVRGQQPMAFTARPIYEQGGASTLAGLDEDADATAATSTSTPDIGAPSGTQGGWFGVGAGGGFSQV